VEQNLEERVLPLASVWHDQFCLIPEDQAILGLFSRIIITKKYLLEMFLLRISLTTGVTHSFAWISSSVGEGRKRKGI